MTNEQVIEWETLSPLEDFNQDALWIDFDSDVYWRKELVETLHYRQQHIDTLRQQALGAIAHADRLAAEPEPSIPDDEYDPELERELDSRAMLRLQIETETDWWYTENNTDGMFSAYEVDAARGRVWVRRERLTMQQRRSIIDHLRSTASAYFAKAKTLQDTTIEVRIGRTHIEAENSA